MGKAIFITGTGTDIGKTALSLALILWAKSQGLRVAYYKPVQCGTFPYGFPPSPYTDADWIRALAGPEISVHVTYALVRPASPHLAAEAERIAIDLGRIEHELDALAGAHDLVVMEGAGGAAVPLNRNGDSFARLAGELSLPCLIASAPGLGTLHHTLTTFAYLKSFKAPIAGFVFCHREPMVPDVCADNRLTLQALSQTPCFGELGYCPELASGYSEFKSKAKDWHLPLAPALEAWWNQD
jgi:dethiobiotin synthetase